MRFLIWLVIGAAVVTWIMRFKSGIAQANRPRQNKPKPAPKQAEAMLQCAACGVHFPASEALTGASGNAFCCAEHRAAHDAR